MSKRVDKIILTSQFAKEWLKGKAPMTKGEAWIRLLIECNNGEYKRNGVEVVGVAGHSQAEWADIFRWTRQQVRGFFSQLAREGKATIKTTSSATYVKIMVAKVYHGYQPDSQPASNQPLPKNARPDSPEDVKGYFVHLGLHPSIAEKQAELFYNHHNSKGWLIGNSKTPMKDWKSACVTWKGNMKNDTTQNVGNMDRQR